MSPFPMPLPTINPIAMVERPPASNTPVSDTKDEHSFEKSLDKALADRVEAPEPRSDRSKPSEPLDDQAKEAETDSGVTTPERAQEPNAGSEKEKSVSDKPETEAKDSAQTHQEREQLKERKRPHGADGIAALEVREQVFGRLAQAKQGERLPLSAERSGQTQPPLDEVLLQQAALIQAEKRLAEEALAKNNAFLPGHETGTPSPSLTPSPTLPSAGLAFLTEMLAQSGQKTNQPSKIVLPTTNNSAAQALGGGVQAGGKGGTTPLPTLSSSLSAHAPNFADELIERVGRIRVLSRGGGAEQQVRITLIPEELGTLDLRLRVDAQNQVHLLITAENEAARDLMNRQMSQLREALERQNMGFGEVFVQVDDRQQGGQEATQWQFGKEREEARMAHHMGETTAEQEKVSAISAASTGLSIFA